MTDLTEARRSFARGEVPASAALARTDPPWDVENL